jgi:hypothetical protein
MTGSPEPKKETVRIIVSPRSNSPSPVRAPAMPAHASTKTGVEMKQTQPLIDLPAVEMPVTKMTIAPPSSHPAPQMQIDDIPTPFYWALLATSATILILQIWNYLS